MQATRVGGEARLRGVLEGGDAAGDGRSGAEGSGRTGLSYNGEI